MSLRSGQVLGLVVLAASLTHCDGEVALDPGECTDGALEALRCFDAPVVAAGETCTFVDRTRTCVDGAWDSEACAHSSCAVTGLASCGATPHGNSEERSCYVAATVPFGATCTTVMQTRTCNDGAWSPDFPEPCHASCEVAPSQDCGATAHGQSETRPCYAAAVAPYGSTCTSTQQTRTCVSGVWSPDWPSCDNPSCEVAPPAACGDQPHGTVETRTCYSAPSVLFGETCTGPTQSRTCDDGVWSPSYPSCANLTCYVEEGVRCGDTLHGAYESRACYDAASVAFAAECTFAWQDRLCDDGAWTPDYDACPNLTCSVGAPPDYSSEHGWTVIGTGCTPNVDEREYNAVAVWGSSVYAAYRGDTFQTLHRFDTATGTFVEANEGYRTGDLGIVVDSTGVYTAGQVYQNWYLEKRDHTTLARITTFGSYVPGVRQGASETLLRLVGRDQQLWILVERYTAPSGYEWVLGKLSGVDATNVASFGTSGLATTTVRREAGEQIPEYALALGAGHLYVAVRTDVNHVLIEKRDVDTGALVPGFGDGGLLSINAPRAGVGAALSVVEHLGRLYLAASGTVFQLNNARGNVVWTYAAGFNVQDIIADETGLYVDDRVKLGHDGAVVWTSTAITARNPTLALAGHWLYVAGSRVYTGSLCTNMRYRDLLGRQSRWDGLLHP